MRKAALQDCNARSAEVLCEVSNTNCLLLRTTVMVYCMIKQLYLFHSSALFSFDTMSPNSTSFIGKRRLILQWTSGDLCPQRPLEMVVYVADGRNFTACNCVTHVLAN